MKQKTLLYGSIGLLWTVGVIGYALANDTMDWLVIGLFSGFFAILIWFMIILPLWNYLFGIQGTKHYIIKKNKHYASLLPSIKPMLGGGKYLVKIRVYKEIFDYLKDIDNNKQREYISEQISKFAGFNYGLPNIFGPTHKNSLRGGFQIENDKQFTFGVYERLNEMFNFHAQQNITKYGDNAKPVDFVDLEMIMNTKKGYIEIDGIRFYLLEKKFYGYYLIRPYFGGKYPTHRDLKFTYTIKRIK